MKYTIPKLLTLSFSVILFLGCASTKISKQQKTNKATVKMWFEEGWNNKRTKELVPVCFDENWEEGNPILPDQMMGHEGMYQLLDRFNSAFTDIHFDLTHVFAEGNYVCVRYYVDATHIGDFFGVPPTNKKITTSGMAVYELENGKIKVSFAETDFLGVLTQIK